MSKTLEQQTKRAGWICLFLGLACIALSLLSNWAGANTCPAPESKTKHVAHFRAAKEITVIQNCEAQAAKQVEVTRTVVVEREAPRKLNSVSLLGVANPTNLSVTNNGGGSYSYQNGYQADAGLMYQRELSTYLRGSLGGTVRGTAFFGLGLNF